MPAVESAPELGLQQPYPGLRPFELDEALQFYGRETHTAELLRRLSENRFLGVVGSSGSGKSSLVRAGLLPALYRGRLVGATSQWRICVMRPGSTPLANLAEVLAGQNVLSRDPQIVLQEISRSSLGLVRAVRAADFAEGESLLLVVDQFEELFRFVRERKEEDGGAEARLFVSSLVEAADVFTAPVYVVLTMRSDFMGDCTQFVGLPEALNRSQYLIPRLTREQVRDAIEKPLRLVGARMSPRLVERLLNELGDDTGQLPVLQHVLNRTFQQFRESGAEGEITVDHYLAAGAMDGALDAHADSLLSSLGDAAQPWAEKFFRCLTTVEGGRKVRRPTRLDRVCEIAGARDPASRERIREIIRAYSHRDHSLVFWSGTQLTEASVIDISHESLIARWARLELWTEAESKSTGWYRSASDDVVRNRSGEAGTWRDPELSLALRFIEQGFWNPAWAARLTGCAAAFDEVEDFLKQGAAEQRREQEAEESRRARELSDARALAEAEQKGREQAEANAAAEARAKRWLVVAAVFLLLAAVAGAAFAWSRQQEVAALKTAAAAERRADELRSQLDSKLRSNQEEINSIKAQLQNTNQSQANLDQLKLQLDAKEKEKANIEMQRVAAEGKANSQQTDLAAALSQIDALKESLKKEQDNAASARTSTDKVVSDLRTKNDDLDKKLRALTPQLMTVLGSAYAEGRNGLPKDDTQAVAWFRKAADGGDARGMANLGRMYANGRGGLPKDDAQALAWYRKSAESGDGLGMGRIGTMYLNGWGGLPKDDAQAVAWYRKSAEAGEPFGMTDLGFMYEWGRGGLPKDDVQAVAWYRKAAEGGDELGMSNLGSMYRDGLGGLPKDDAQAVAWYRKSAEAAAAAACPTSATCTVMAGADCRRMTLRRSPGTENQAPRPGRSRGMSNLGYMYEVGRGGLPKDDVQALAWFRKAAEAGDETGMYNLGVMLEAGRGGLPKDLDQAVAWYRKAADDGNESARNALKRLGR